MFFKKSFLWYNNGDLRDNMKNKVRYKYMPKDKRKVVRNEFKNTKYGKQRRGVLNRLFVEGILCLIMGTILLVYSIVSHMEWHYYGLAILLILGGVVFTIAQVVVRHMEYDKYIEESKKKKRK